MTPGQRDQQQRIDDEHRTWEALARLADDGDLLGFYRGYVAYLEQNKVISSGRASLLKIARLTVARLERD